LRCGDPSTLFKVTGPTPTTEIIDCGDQAELDQFNVAIFQSERELQLDTNSGTSGGSVDESPSEWTLTGLLACGDPIFSYGVVGSCTRSGLTRWLGSRTHPSRTGRGLSSLAI
jgi:hypothetical protein